MCARVFDFLTNSYSLTLSSKKTKQNKMTICNEGSYWNTETIHNIFQNGTVLTTLERLCTPCTFYDARQQPEIEDYGFGTYVDDVNSPQACFPRYVDINERFENFVIIGSMLMLLLLFIRLFLDPRDLFSIKKLYFLVSFCHGVFSCFIIWHFSGFPQSMSSINSTIIIFTTKQQLICGFSYFFMFLTFLGGIHTFLEPLDEFKTSISYFQIVFIPYLFFISLGYFLFVSPQLPLYDKNGEFVMMKEIKFAYLKQSRFLCWLVVSSCLLLFFWVYEIQILHMIWRAVSSRIVANQRQTLQQSVHEQLSEEIQDGESVLISNNIGRCSICLEKQVNRMARPCNHLSYCSDCVKTLQDNSNNNIIQCCICRKNISSFVAVYIDVDDQKEGEVKI
jgi:hypothetical protein